MWVYGFLNEVTYGSRCRFTKAVREHDCLVENRLAYRRPLQLIWFQRRLDSMKQAASDLYVSDSFTVNTQLKRRRRMRRATYAPQDPLLNAPESAAETGRAISTFWRDVKAGRLPPPYYVTPRCPRWRRSELRAAVDACRAPVVTCDE